VREAKEAFGAPVAPQRIMEGAVPAEFLALATDAGLGALERVLRPPR
jgi:ABC-type proline/glycine betaine transport system permease subunit